VRFGVERTESSTLGDVKTTERIRMPRNMQRSSSPIEAFTACLDAQVDLVPANRRHFVGWMEDADLDGETIDELEVVFSELAANAVAASPTASHVVRIRVHMDGSTLVLEVSNHTDRPHLLCPSVPDLDDPLRPSGRGLLITRAFVHSVDIEVQHPDRLVVRCYRHLGTPN